MGNSLKLKSIVSLIRVSLEEVVRRGRTGNIEGTGKPAPPHVHESGAHLLLHCEPAVPVRVSEWSRQGRTGVSRFDASRFTKLMRESP